MYIDEKYKMNMSNLKYAVVGVGALGGFYGGMLAKAGADVHFLFHSDYDHVKKYGLRVDSVLGDFIINKPNAYNSSYDMPACDVVLVMMKTISNNILKKILPPLLKEDTTVILIQNGLSIESELEKDFPGIAIGGGLAFICSNKTGPGYIKHLDYGKLTIGKYKGDDNVFSKICSDFNGAGVPAYFAADLMLARWKKLVWNVPYNGLCVALKSDTKDLMDNEYTRALLKDMMLEVIAAACANGYRIEKSFADEMLKSTDSMKPYNPSMKLDFDNKRNMEIKAIYSNTIEAARIHGLDMPKVKMLEQELKYIQSKY